MAAAEGSAVLAESQRDELLKLERDLQIGREIQAGFLPAVLPDLPDWQIATSFKPAREVGGDFYDAFLMAGGRRVGFVVADVCDKGVGAALFMALFRTLVRSNAQQNVSLNWLSSRQRGSIGAQAGRDTDGEEWLTGSAVRGRDTLPSIGTGGLLNAVAGTNDYVVENHPMQGYFATLFMGVLDPVSGRVAYVNGGHNPPVVIRADGGLELLGPTGPAVGIMPNARFELAQTALGPGDILYNYTDGVIDARSKDGTFFGEERLHERLRGGGDSATGLVASLEAELQSHMSGSVQYDDITMLALMRSGRPDADAPKG